MKSVFTQDELIDLYGWIDTIPLSRKKRNLARDFSDAVLMAEVVNHFYPKSVDLFNYQQGLRVDTKIYNWTYLNEKVLKKLHFPLDTQTITELANSTPGTIERVLWNFRDLVDCKPEENEKPYFIDSDSDLDRDPVEQYTESQSFQDRKLLEQKIAECEEHEEYISLLENKIEKLEQLIKLKDAKIAKLTRQLEKRQ
ncbi:hypothetical protein TVAG_173660 [Trichomonas vaginalis G3]|uniref:Calponin-homology (CH) domain-containing protein n=1 Tax=Trichomonas vaginalis (strain ATCC PRA-98 / G3) TaxID=412133 RepID=A2EVI9_TRIV3|nr:sperm protein CH-like domain-containing protein [Trichomonas vaginalis G3]EAY03321.1 hypothetical protein TVAG_173660 [Trichomonas vaginalis G3]KAI5498340.1 sperm protein CH-like domain-containing protein [Trichomonas vaginalis G3]|eukprot:XP_001315544.1 hypothetical protein [Trichomonas vaginalis G3]